MSTAISMIGRTCFRSLDPQHSGLGEKNLTEKAWLPFLRNSKTWAARCVASGFMAYDDQNYYFAAKIADATPYRRQYSLRHA